MPNHPENTSAPIGAAAAAPLAAVAIEKGAEVAQKIIEMIQDKELRDEAKSKFNEFMVAILKAAYAAERNYRKRVKKLTPAQQQQLAQRFKECEHKTEEAVDELTAAVNAANAGKKEVAKDHFETAEKKARAARECFEKLIADKEEMIAANAPDQPQDGAF